MVAQYSDIMPEEPVGEHDVYFDYGGSRLTCHSCPEGPDRTLLRQPSQTNMQEWQARLAEFRRKHPWPQKLPRAWR